jgi:hypothetical protein
MVRDYAAAKEFMSEYNEDMLFADGFDHCITGIVELFGKPPIALYDKTKVLATLMKDGMTYEDANEYYEYNMLGAFMGESTPAYFIPLIDIYED